MSGGLAWQSHSGFSVRSKKYRVQGFALSITFDIDFVTDDADYGYRVWYFD